MNERHTVVDKPSAIGLFQACCSGLRGEGGEDVFHIRRIAARVHQALHRYDGQGLAEYALILALIAVVAIVALMFMGTQVSNKLSVIGSTIQSVQ
jgi:pilus assembly protein Flp/PilA